MIEHLSSLEDLVRHAGSGWMLDPVESVHSQGNFLERIIGQVRDTARDRLMDSLDFTPERLVAAYKKSPQKIRAFIQALGESSTPEMLLMVWRVIHGMTIERLTIHYILEQDFHLEVRLQSPSGDPMETYESNDVDDLALVRHFAITKTAGRPVVDGFYPLRAS